MIQIRMCSSAVLASSVLLPLSVSSVLAGVPVLKPLPHPVGQPGGAPQAQAAAVATSSASPAPSSWTPLTNQPTFLADGASNPILLTDGSVLIQDAGFPDWWKLTPDQTGSYVNGTWTQVASIPGGYSPLYHSSAVLPDGRLIMREASTTVTRPRVPATLCGRREGRFMTPWRTRGRWSPRRLAGQRSVTHRASCWPTERTCRRTAAPRKWRYSIRRP